MTFLSEAERHQLLVEWNTTQANYPKKCVHYLFEQQAELTPEAIVLVFEDQHLTYCELNSRANQLAHYLQTLGVGPEVLVGLCIERSIEMVIGLLAVLKAGGAYVPLDPVYPTGRLAYMLRDSQITVLLTQERLLGQLSEHQAKVVCLDSDWRDIAEHDRTYVKSEVKAENLAYMIYTSGSTGYPKGVLIEHRGLCNVIQAQSHVFHVQSKDHVLQFASLSFDAATSEIFMAFTAGAMLYLGTLELFQSGFLLSQLLREQAITLVTLTPSLLKILPSEELTELRTVISVGEKCSSEIIARWAPDCQFFNAYGPTETTICVSIFECEAESSGSVIGRPIANTQLYVLDHYLQPVPIGVPGELYIGGAGVARGYLHRPELTAERFLSNPFSDDPNARFYKTGDLVRYLPDGNLEFLERLDHQVKIRGFRIELGEIEAVLVRHLAIREAVVVTRENPTGDKRLVAYLITAQPPSPSPRELHNYLLEWLPNYMLPTAFVLLEALPLTPNGKVDRNALRALEGTKYETEAEYIAPRTFIEKVIARIWTEVLGKKQIGIYDTFFELGGDSLLATQVVSRIREFFHIELLLRFLFDTATIAGLAQQIENMTQTISELHPSAISPFPRNEVLPLSIAQQRLWLLEQLAPGTAVYTLSLALRFTGPLHTVALEQSLNEIVRRHEALRTSFPVIDGHPVQMIAATFSLTLERIDLREFSEGTREAEAQRLINQEARHSFDLAHIPLMRANLWQIKEQEYIFLLSMHHIVSDGWSIGILLRELATLYEAYSHDQPIPLRELPIQYADFTLWQRQWLKTGVLTPQLAYWKKQLDGIPALLQLPIDHPRHVIQTQAFRGVAIPFSLSHTLTAALKTLSQQHGITLFMTLLAAFQVLLFRYSGQEDIVVGTPIAGRTHQQIEELIGFFVNTLVLRTNLSGNPSFLDLLKRVREVALDAYTHQDVPFERLVEELQPARDLSYNPLFQVFFVLQNAFMETVDFTGLQVRLLKIDSTTAQFDLILDLTETAAGLEGWLVYNSDLFEAATIRQMASHLQVLLTSICQNSDQPIGELALLSEAERHQLLVEWNATQRNYPKEQCIHQLFEAQVEYTPEAIALAFQSQHFTYRELNCRANQLAHYLQTLGVGPEVIVGVCMERSVEMVVGLLAILKAGGAYVPLDPTYPTERLVFMLQDSHVKVLLTSEHLRLRLPAFIEKRVNLDSGWKHIEEYSQTPVLSGVQAENLAYMIYTSGSMGLPKGVCCSHIGVVNLLDDFAYKKPLVVGDHCSLWTRLSFDVSVYEIFSSLCAGGTLYLVPDAVLAQGTQFIQWLGRVQITSAYIPAFMLFDLSALLREGRVSLSLRRMLVGVEPIQEQLLVEISQQIDGLLITNGYGPTEATICATLYEVRPGATLNRRTPIGYPVQNTDIYLLDSNLQPVPVGTSGEIYLGGAGLARSYFNRPELTAEKFIPHPFSHEPGRRLYKTGDLARYLPDRTIEFLQRIDHQVKIRGFRIELGEIETILAEHSDVQEAVVMIQENNLGEKHLVAFILPAFEVPLTSSQLRSYLQGKLPNYMIPSSLVLLEYFPLLPNSKLDRRTLLAHLNESLLREEYYVPPGDVLEEVLVDMWIEILGKEPVGISDNFFALGGHSLLATQIIARIQGTFQVELPVSMLFEKPTIKELAPAIVAGERKPGQVQRVAHLIKTIKSLSDDDARKMLESKKKKRGI